MNETTTAEQVLIKVTELVEVVKDIREFVPRTIQPKADPPQHGDANWVIGYLEISESTFFRHVRGKLLEPVLRIGTREYYDRGEVYDLLRRVKETRRSVGFLTKKQQEEAPASFFVPLTRQSGTQMSRLGTLGCYLPTQVKRKRSLMQHQGSQPHRLRSLPAHQRSQMDGKRYQMCLKWNPIAHQRTPVDHLNPHMASLTRQAQHMGIQLDGFGTLANRLMPQLIRKCTQPQHPWPLIVHKWSLSAHK